MRTLLLAFGLALTQLGNPQAPYEISLAIERTSYQYGEDVVAQVSLTNVIENDIFVSDPSRQSALDSLGFLIVDRRTGETTNLWDGTQSAGDYSGEILELAPGAKATYNLGLFWDDLLLPAQNVIEPGKYELYAVYVNQQTSRAQLQTKGHYTFDAVVKSKGVQFEVTAPTAERKKLFTQFCSAFRFNSPIAERIKSANSVRNITGMPADLRGRLMVYEGRQLKLAGRIDDAVYLFQSALKLLPWQADALNLRSAQVLLEAGRTQSAFHYLGQSRLPQAKRLLKELTGD